MSELYCKTEGVKVEDVQKCTELVQTTFRSHPVLLTLNVSLGVCVWVCGWVGGWILGILLYTCVCLPGQEKLLSNTDKSDPATVEKMLSKQLVCFFLGHV